jgi:Fe-S-cluster-containing hydrogenase component 2
MLNVICPHNCKDCFALRVCAVHAVKDQQGSIYVQTDECIGCGCCKTACLTFGYRALEDKTTQWLKGAA